LRGTKTGSIAKNFIDGLPSLIALTGIRRSSSLQPFSYLNFCGLTFFSILSKKVDQVFVWNEETSFLGERCPQRGQVSSA